MLASTLFTLTVLVTSSMASYVLEDDYSPSSFFSMFDFFTGADPTAGYVTYVDQAAAQSQGLINTQNNAVYMGVDHTNVASGSGRSSVRVTSKKSYNHGLIILDAAHMPGGICGTWPAFWTVGPNWPAEGEIDIIEGVNSQASNSMTLHTGAGCSITNSGLFSGSLETSNCDINAAGQATNAGCSIGTSNTASFGSGFNAAQGGVYATEWTSSAISIWFFPRSAIPSDIAAGSPDPTSWGSATASFAGGCAIDSFFMNQQIVFDTTFCGDWAGNVWTTDPVCSSKASTCQSYVQNNPSAFANAYWSVNSLKVYQSNGATPATSVASAGPSSLPISSAIPGTIPVSSRPGVPASSFGIPPVATAGSTTLVQTQPAPGTSNQANTFGFGRTRTRGGTHAAVQASTNVATVGITATSSGVPLLLSTVAAALAPETQTPVSLVLTSTMALSNPASSLIPTISHQPAVIEPTSSSVAPLSPSTLAAPATVQSPVAASLAPPTTMATFALTPSSSPPSSIQLPATSVIATTVDPAAAPPPTTAVVATSSAAAAPLPTTAVVATSSAAAAAVAPAGTTSFPRPPAYHGGGEGGGGFFGGNGWGIFKRGNSSSNNKNKRDNVISNGEEVSNQQLPNLQPRHLVRNRKRHGWGL